MSRFFEALKQASRSPSAKREDAEPDSLDISAILNLPEPGADVPEAVLPEPALSIATEPSGASVEQSIPPQETPQSSSMGLSVETSMDPKTRLIINSVEPEILEPCRQLRTHIMQLRAEKAFRTLLVASSESREGKTLTVLNLAYVFSMLPSFRVLVVDGDIRSGSLTRIMGVKGRAGLSELLEGSAKLNEVVLKSADIPFSFMLRGHSKLSPPELLHSSRWAIQSKRISEHFDLVLVDSPPVGFVTDAQLLASGCEAIVLVVRAFKTSRESLEKLTREFRRFRVLGTVLNGSMNLGGYRSYRSYFHDQQ